MSLKEDFMEALNSVKRDFFQKPAYNAQPVPEMAGNTHSDGQRHANAEEPVAMSAAATEEPPETAFSGYAAEPTSRPTAEETPAAEYFESFAPEPQPSARVTATAMERDPFSEGEEHTVISRNTVIRGAIQTQDSIRLMGQVLGDIECQANILLAGKVRGTTTAANAHITGAQVDGDIRCDDVIRIDHSAWVLGNIKAQQAEVEGKVKGNLDIRHAISIGSDSSILGNISTDEIEIKRGAFVNGQIMMYSPSRDVLDQFESIKEG